MDCNESDLRNIQEDGSMDESEYSVRPHSNRVRECVCVCVCVPETNTPPRALLYPSSTKTEMPQHQRVRDIKNYKLRN